MAVVRKVDRERDVSSSESHRPYEQCIDFVILLAIPAVARIRGSCLAGVVRHPRHAKAPRSLQPLQLYTDEPAVDEISAITTAGLIAWSTAWSDRSAGVLPLVLCRFHFESSQPKLATAPNHHHHTTTTPSIKQWQDKRHYDHVTNQLNDRERSIRFDGVLLLALCLLHF